MTVQAQSSLLVGHTPQEIGDLGEAINHLGQNAIRFSIAVVLLWIGAMKFTAYEASAIEGLVQSSPFISWLYGIFSVQGVSNLIGTIEILSAIALILGYRFSRIGLAGALAAVATFLLTSSFLLSAPGWEASLGGFPALSVVPGQFLLKDIVLLAGSVFLFGDSLQRIAGRT